MNIGVAYDNGQIAANRGSCRQVLIVTTEGREPVSKHMAEVPGTSTTDLIKLASMEQIDVLICGSLGLAIREQQGGASIASAISTIAGGAIIIAAAVYFGMLDTSWLPA